MLRHLLNERTFALSETLADIAGERGTKVPCVTLVWLSAQPVHVSPILGARTCQQLDDKLAAVDVKLE